MRERISLFILICCSLFALEVQAQIPPIVPPVIDPGQVDPSGGGTTGTIEAPKVDPKAAEINAEEKKVKDQIAEEKKEQQKREEEKDILARKRQEELPEPKIWGQQFFRDQSIKLFDRSKNQRAIESYRIASGDEIEVTVWGAVDFSRSVSVNDNGYIDLSIPDLLVPRLYIKGMKFSDVRDAIYQRLSRHMNMKGSNYDVQLNYSRSITVNITGEVFSPGSYTIPATNTAFNALVASGGPSQIGSVRRIKVISSDHPTRQLDVYKFANNPNVSEAFFLDNNDYIFVPLAEKVVEVRGSVKRPFHYELLEGEQLLEALEFAGGVKADAYLRNIQIKRYANDEERIIDVNLAQIIDNKENFPLMNGDIIELSPISEAYSNYVTVEGAVKLPGEYELGAGTKILEVLQKSGIMLSAVKENIYVRRLRPDFSIEYISVSIDSILAGQETANIRLRALDKVEVKFKSEFVDEYKVQIYGAVRKPGPYIHSDSLTLEDLLYLANGIEKEAANSILEISRLVPQSDGSSKVELMSYDINADLKVIGAEGLTLKPRDQIFVRLTKNYKLPQNVSIHGEIAYPGAYTLQDNGERIADLLDRAGGPTALAFLEGARLIRPGEGFVVLDLKDVAKNPNSRFNYILRPGDSLSIPVVKDLVAIGGRINHPEVKNKSEIAEIELKLKLLKTKSKIEREEIQAKEAISRKTNPDRINVPFHKGKRANYYLKEYAGGIDRANGGRKRLVYVRYPSGAVKKTRNYFFFKYYPKVTKGAMVYVDTKTKTDKQNIPKKKRAPIEWNRVIQNGVAITSSTLTLLLAIRALNN